LEIIKLYLGDYKRNVYLREISRLANIPLNNVQQAVSSLEKDKILKSRIQGKNKYFSLNLDNVKSKLYLLHAEIYKTQAFLEKYPQCKLFMKEHIDIPIIVFGSFAKFTAKDDSDLDLLIIAAEGTKLPLHLLPYKVHDIRITKKSFVKALEKQETLIKEIEESHVILNDHSFYVDVMWWHHAK